MTAVPTLWNIGTNYVDYRYQLGLSATITLFVKGNSFPALYDTLRDDPGALHKVDREGFGRLLASGIRC